MKYEFSSGLGSWPIADPTAKGGSVVVRFRMELANVNDDEGLLEEMRRALPHEKRMPWANRERHAWALKQLERGPYPGMSVDEQRVAIEYIRRTPFYE